MFNLRETERRKKRGGGKQQEKPPAGEETGRHTKWKGSCRKLEKCTGGRLIKLPTSILEKGASQDAPLSQGPAPLTSTPVMEGTTQNGIRVQYREGNGRGKQGYQRQLGVFRMGGKKRKKKGLRGFIGPVGKKKKK